MTNNRVHGNKSKAAIKRRVTQWISDRPAQPRRLASKQNPAAVCLPDAEPLPGTFNVRVSAPLIASVRLGAVLPSFHKIHIPCVFSPLSNTPRGRFVGTGCVSGLDLHFQQQPG